MENADSLRAQAARSRRLASEATNKATCADLFAYAQELEARALKMEIVQQNVTLIDQGTVPLKSAESGAASATAQQPAQAASQAVESMTEPTAESK